MKSAKILVIPIIHHSVVHLPVYTMTTYVFYTHGKKTPGFGGQTQGSRQTAHWSEILTQMNHCRT